MKKRGKILTMASLSLSLILAQTTIPGACVQSRDNGGGIFTYECQSSDIQENKPLAPFYAYFDPNDTNSTNTSLAKTLLYVSSNLQENNLAQTSIPDCYGCNDAPGTICAGCGCAALGGNKNNPNSFGYRCSTSMQNPLPKPTPLSTDASLVGCLYDENGYPRQADQRASCSGEPQKIQESQPQQTFIQPVVAPEQQTCGKNDELNPADGKCYPKMTG